MLSDGYTDGLNKIREVFHVTLTPNRPTVSYNSNRLSILMYTLYTHVLPGVTWKNNRCPNCRDALVDLLVTLDQKVSSSCLFTPNCYFYVVTITFISSAVVSNIYSQNYNCCSLWTISSKSLSKTGMLPPYILSKQKINMQRNMLRPWTYDKNDLLFKLRYN